MPSTISPNMGLIVPAVGPNGEPGPAWALDTNADWSIIDQHNHSAGQGVSINPDGININTDLPMNGNNLTLVNTVRFNNLSGTLAGATPNLGVIYQAVGNLYFNDGAGNVVQITKSGSVNATSSGISSGTASASFSGGVLVVDANTNTPANVQGASFLFGNNISGSQYLTLQPPSAMASSYTATLPPPNTTGSTVFLTYDTSNNIGLGPSTTSGVLTPSGSIIMYGGVSAPTGYLICDGTSYLIATYPALAVALFDSGTGNYAYGSADSSHFNVPDFRGVFPRGVDNGAGNDPDSASRTVSYVGSNSGDNVGSVQAWQIQSHDHARNPSAITEEVYFAGGGLGPTSGTFQQVTESRTGATGGNQTNPINLYVNFIIKT